MGNTASKANVIMVYVGEELDSQPVTLPKNSGDMKVSELKALIVSTLHVECYPENTSLIVMHPGNCFTANRNLSLAACGIGDGTVITLNLKPTPPSSRGQYKQHLLFVLLCCPI